MNILIAENSTTMGRVLKAVSHTAVPHATLGHVLDGLVALDMLELEQTDLMIVNWSLPRIDGIELVKRMRKNPKLQKVPVIMVSTLRDRSNVMTALQAGVNDICLMPIQPDVLSAKILNQIKRIKK